LGTAPIDAFANFSEQTRAQPEPAPILVAAFPESNGVITEGGGSRKVSLAVRGNSGGGFDEKTAFRNFDRAPDGEPPPGRPRYTGPIALLIDEWCSSAGAGWAAWFIARKRARVFGTTTAGTSSRKETYTLSNGLYRVEVPVKLFTGFLDRPIERRGLEPDVELRCSARDLARGKDTVVEAAAQWLARTGRPGAPRARNADIFSRN